jgi:predicted nucleotidyltransferase component of viral defense system
VKDILQKKLETYQIKNSDEELNALKEITQEIALYSLYKVGFFRNVSFMGGTCLRILHGLDRFSEDLDFATKKLDTSFRLGPYLEEAVLFMNAYGLNLTISGSDKIDKNIQARFLKDDSIKKVLTFKHVHDSKTKIKIKIEIDTHPPQGAAFAIEYGDFPLDFPVTAYDLPCLMAGKIHALLCRPYTKGRDWYDFLWYLANGVSPNLVFIKNSLYQYGPWKNNPINVDLEFIRQELAKKVIALNWKDVSLDVRKFLNSERAKSLELWSGNFFQKKVSQLK